jgi:hypothetical protein
MKAQIGLLCSLLLWIGGFAVLGAAENSGMLAHHVFFTLKDKSPESADQLIAACHKYLKNQKGVVCLAAGKRAPELKRDVNDQDFDVSLHIVFKTAADQEAYQKDAKHLKFIEENSARWAKVRVFDSYLK